MVNQFVIKLMFGTQARHWTARRCGPTYEWKCIGGK